MAAAGRTPDDATVRDSAAARPVASAAPDRASASGNEEGYSFTEGARILGVPEAKLRYWAQTGFVGPSVRKGVRQLYTFADLVAVRAAKELSDRGFSAAEIRAALLAARDLLPAGATISALRKLRVAFDGQVLVVVDQGVAFEASGQRVFDFGLDELAVRAGAAIDTTPIAPARGSTPARAADAASVISTVQGRKPSAYDWFVEGLSLQTTRAAEAAECFRRALAADPGLAAAHTNLGTIAHAEGDRAGARVAFERAIELDPEQAEARFNLANLLLEDGQTELGADELRRVLQVSPDFADAHYNLASALYALGGKAQAREHWQAFLRLAGPAGTDADNADPWIVEARRRLMAE